MSEIERHPIGRVLSGQAIHPLPDSWTPLDAFVRIKWIDDDGDSSWSFRTTNALNLEELLGALTVQVEMLKRKLTGAWADED